MFCTNNPCSIYSKLEISLLANAYVYIFDLFRAYSFSPLFVTKPNVESSPIKQINKSNK